VSDTCAGQARAHDVPRAGTAPTALGWLLVEQPGSWGRDALTGSGLDPALGAALAERVADLPVRVQAIRRPAGDPLRSPAARTVVLAHAGAPSWAERLTLDDTALAELDPALCAAPTPPGLGTPVTEPWYLVCTHGKRDRCCATLGRPIVDTLAALHPAATWEVSHVGGHRFAGNLVVLPEGLVFGGLQVVDAVRALDLLRVGRLDLDHLRGRSGLPRPAQAADVLVRRRLGVDRVTAVPPEAVEVADPGPLPPAVGEALRTVAGARVDPGPTAVDLDVVGHGRVRAVVAEVPLGIRALASCDADEPEEAGGYVLLGLDPLPRS
jgi:hypothetical protein